MKRERSLMLVLLLIAAVRCAPAPTSIRAPYRLETQLSMGADGQTIIRVGATNTGTIPIAQNDAFGGVMELRDRGGELRSEIPVHQYGALKPQQTDLPVELRTRLDPGYYRLTWTAPVADPLMLEFGIVERDGKRFLRAEPRFIQPFTEYTIAEPSGG